MHNVGVVVKLTLMLGVFSNLVLMCHAPKIGWSSYFWPMGHFIKMWQVMNHF